MLAAMLAFGHRAVGFLAPILKALAPWILAGVLGATAFHLVPAIGSRARLERLETDRDNWRTAARDQARAAAGWTASFRSAERRREKESTTADEAVAAQTVQCAAQVAAARKSARAIERIVTQEVRYDESRCPIRSVVDADLLRDSLAAP